jgi:hypothetical protein
VAEPSAACAGFFGILIEPADGSKPKLIPGTASPHLKRVK